MPNKECPQCGSVFYGKPHTHNVQGKQTVFDPPAAIDAERLKKEIVCLPFALDAGLNAEEALPNMIAAARLYLEAAAPPDLQQVQARLLEVESACSRAKRLVRKAYEQVADVSEELANGDLLSALQELEEAKLGGQVYMDLVAMLKNGAALQQAQQERDAARAEVERLKGEAEKHRLGAIHGYMCWEGAEDNLAKVRDRLAALAPLAAELSFWKEPMNELTRNERDEYRKKFEDACGSSGELERVLHAHGFNLLTLAGAFNVLKQSEAVTDLLAGLKELQALVGETKDAQEEAKDEAG